MQINVRPPSRAEMSNYYKALPSGNGLPSWEAAPAAWHGGSEPWPQPRQPATAEQLEAWADSSEKNQNFHPVAAFADGRLVGASAMLSFEVTVPGSLQLPMAGVTGTGVLATHRRRGLLRKMMQTMFDAAIERGEPISMLSASEGSIYGRFGFSPATYRTRWELERSQAELFPVEDTIGSLELIGASEASAIWPVLHERVRHSRVGELSAQPGRWNGLSDTASGTDSPLRYLVHRDSTGTVDGIANFKLPWSRTVDDVGTLVVEALEATNPSAYRALWHLLLDFDLTRKVVAHSRPRDEPLRQMLRNPRAMRITRQSDNLWMRILDVPAALAARTYSTPDTIAFSVQTDEMVPNNVGTWRLEADVTGASCVRTNDAPDLTLDIQALGALYLGGMSAQLLAAAGLIRSDQTSSIEKLSRMFRTDPEPHNSFGF